jgi:hypothetical protein
MQATCSCLRGRSRTIRKRGEGKTIRIWGRMLLAEVPEQAWLHRLFGIVAALRRTELHLAVNLGIKPQNLHHTQMWTILSSIKQTKVPEIYSAAMDLIEKKDKK